MGWELAHGSKFKGLYRVSAFEDWDTLSLLKDDFRTSQSIYVFSVSVVRPATLRGGWEFPLRERWNRVNRTLLGRGEALLRIQQEEAWGAREPGSDMGPHALPPDGDPAPLPLGDEPGAPGDDALLDSASAPPGPVDNGAPAQPRGPSAPSANAPAASPPAPAPKPPPVKSPPAAILGNMDLEVFMHKRTLGGRFFQKPSGTVQDPGKDSTARRSESTSSITSAPTLACAK